MLRKVVCVAVILVLSVSVVMADEIRAVITKVEDNKVTFAEAKGKGEKGAEQTLPVAQNVKVVKGKRNKETKKVEAGEELENGLKNEVFSNIGEKGVRATIVTDSDNKRITEIRVTLRKQKQ
jgi:hypothetical protein